MRSEFVPLVNASFDFGTHASGYGWCEHNVDDEPTLRKIRTFDQWPKQPVPSVKTLTALLLDRDGEVIAWGHSAHQMWVEHRADRRDKGWRYFHGFKMSLARDDAEPGRYRSMALDDREDDPEELITKFLGCLFRHVLADLQASGYEETDTRWCITVPAIWNEHQKAIMRRCAQRAGFPHEDGRLILAYEPEAAAQHARVTNVMVTDADGQSREVFNVPGRRFIVCDCGGGTVDLTSYQIEPDRSMIEMGSVSGEARGAKYVNKAIEEQVLVPRLGGLALYAKLQEHCPEGIEDLLAAWERAKLNIGVDHNRPVYLPITMALAKKIPPRVKRALAAGQDGVDDAIVITPAEVATAFESVVERICALVSEQLRSLTADAELDHGPTVVLLVGGFAASPYLRQRLIDHVGGEAVVLVPPDPQVAVLAGAVHFACRPATRARRSRRTYGISMCMDFEEGVDLESKRDKDTADGTDRCTDRFAVLVTKGDLVPNGSEVWIDGQPVHGDQTAIRVRFSAARGAVPRYVDDPECEYLGRVKVDRSPVMHLHLNDRGIRVYMKFGETEVKSRVVLQATGEEREHSFDLLTS
ncbi:heat shock 70kD protein 12B [Alloactinosynnema sp. L-07]|uniref:Hsp70 family protein n=1 Tax=Alloactinosynnema sp. L-07 TaxID=1653480 RepID=UPI00065EFCD7|nr:hypothetical protein [Alloactinosynnema sp. L-07]CRK56805.1 heat shock 70kD protein 12B [Alloactinosynnema sp. L-07]